MMAEAEHFSISKSLFKARFYASVNERETMATHQKDNFHFDKMRAEHVASRMTG